MNTSIWPIITGFSAGLGLLLIWFSCWDTPAKPRRTPQWLQTLDDDLRAAGFPRSKPRHLLIACASCAALTFFVSYFFTASPAISACFAVFAGWAPQAFITRRARKQHVERRVLWPEAIDHLTSGIRAGLSLPEALAGLAHRGPEPLRNLFDVFAEEYRATGSFQLSLDRFKLACADPVADRIVAALGVTREVGGTDLGTMLRALAHFLREDSRTRAELSARQQWTVTGARLAVGAPWIVLALLSTRPETSQAYNSAAGVTLLLVGLATSIGAYRLMKRIGRLPAEPRVLR